MPDPHYLSGLVASISNFSINDLSFVFGTSGYLPELFRCRDGWTVWLERPCDDGVLVNSSVVFYSAAADKVQLMDIE